MKRSVKRKDREEEGSRGGWVATQSEALGVWRRVSTERSSSSITNRSAWNSKALWNLTVPTCTVKSAGRKPGGGGRITVRARVLRREIQIVMIATATADSCQGSMSLGMAAGVAYCTGASGVLAVILLALTS